MKLPQKGENKMLSLKTVAECPVSGYLQNDLLSVYTPAISSSCLRFGYIGLLSSDKATTLLDREEEKAE